MLVSVLEINLGEVKGEVRVLYIGTEDLDDVAVAVSVEIPLGEHQCLNHGDGHYTRCPLCVGDETPLHHQNVVAMLVHG